MYVTDDEANVTVLHAAHFKSNAKLLRLLQRTN